MAHSDTRSRPGGRRGSGDGGAHAEALHAGRDNAGPLDERMAARIRSALADSFFAHFLRAPALVGGIVPSSRVLGRTLSRHAAGFDAIVELGAGAGSVTRWLVADHPRATLSVIERSPALARRILHEWPRARVFHGCVHERAEVLLAQPARAVAVSSLPFRSLPEDLVRATMEPIERFLLAHPERRLVQYSYGLREPVELASPLLSWRRAGRVWRNVPPATVWVAGQTADPVACASSRERRCVGE